MNSDENVNQIHSRRYNVSSQATSYQREDRKDFSPDNRRRLENRIRDREWSRRCPFCDARDPETINSSVDSTNLRVSDRVGSSEQ